MHRRTLIKTSLGAALALSLWQQKGAQEINDTSFEHSYAVSQAYDG